MNKQLHLLKERNDLKAIEMIEMLSMENPDRIEVVLLQEALETVPSWKSKTYLLRSTGEEPQAGSAEVNAIGYDRLIDLIFEADTVVAW